MSLILTPPPTVMVFFKEISLKNESTELPTNSCTRLGGGRGGGGNRSVKPANHHKIEKLLAARNASTPTKY